MIGHLLMIGIDVDTALNVDEQTGGMRGENSWHFEERCVDNLDGDERREGGALSDQCFPIFENRETNRRHLRENDLRDK